jgi:uncharacterized delta-60 repeat protein
MATHNNAAGGNSWDQGWDVAVDGQGKILVAGNSTGLVGGNQVSFTALWRYNPDGTLDDTFGTGGFVTTQGAAGGNSSDQGFALVLDQAGRILVAGTSVSDAAHPAEQVDMALWRFNPDGTPDLTFDQHGFVTHKSAAGGDKRDVATCLALDSLGRIVTAGISDNGSNGDAVIWRFIP